MLKSTVGQLQSKTAVSIFPNNGSRKLKDPKELIAQTGWAHTEYMYWIIILYSLNKYKYHVSIKNFKKGNNIRAHSWLWNQIFILHSRKHTSHKWTRGITRLYRHALTSIRMPTHDPQTAAPGIDKREEDRGLGSQHTGSRHAVLHPSRKGGL